MRSTQGLLSGLLVATVLAACSSNEEQSKHVSLSATRPCLVAAGFRVVGGPVSKEASNGTGAVGELVIPGAFGALYPSTRIADHAAPRVARNVVRLRGSMARRGNATVAFVGTLLSPPQRRHVLGCLR